MLWKLMKTTGQTLRALAVGLRRPAPPPIQPPPPREKKIVRTKRFVSPSLCKTACPRCNRGFAAFVAPFAEPSSPLPGAEVCPPALYRSPRRRPRTGPRWVAEGDQGGSPKSGAKRNPWLRSNLQTPPRMGRRKGELRPTRRWMQNVAASRLCRKSDRQRYDNRWIAKLSANNVRKRPLGHRIIRVEVPREAGLSAPNETGYGTARNRGK
jgi:hypothetical protein